MKSKFDTLTASITHRLLALEFASEFLVIYPFYTIMFGSRGDVSAAGIGVLLAAWYVTQVIAEVPTGIIADRIPKKWVLVGAKTMRVFAFVVWLVWPDFWGYFIGFVLWGIGWSLSSGAFEAYLYESLPSDGKHKFAHLYARVNALDMAAYVGAFICSFFISTHYNVLLICTIAACIISVGIALSLPKGKRIVATSEKPRVLAAAAQHIFKTAALKELIISAVIVGSLGEVLINFRALYYTQAGAPVRFIPLLLAGENLVAALLFWYMMRFDAVLTRHRVVMIVAVGTIFILSFFSGPAGQVLGLMCVARVTRLIQTHYESAMQHLSKDEVRATIGSIYAFGVKLIAAAMLIFVGIFASGNIIVGSLRMLTLGLAGLFVLVQIAIFVWGHRKSRLTKQGV